MLFSIIVPVYNVEEYLNCCIKSVVTQTYTNFELLLIDDGATDRSGEICDAWAKVDKRVKTLHKANGGPSSARNAGIKMATGDYILFLDSDDYWLSTNILQEIAERVQLTQPDVLVLNLQKDFGGNLSDPYFHKSIEMPDDVSVEDAENIIFKKDLWTACAWNKLTRTELYREGNLYFCEGIIAEDVDWCYRLAIYARRLDFLNINAVGYRQRINSTTGSTSVEKIACLMNNIQTCLELSKETDQMKQKNLVGYLSYQYGTLLHGFAILPASKEKRKLFARIKQMEWLLEHSNNANICLIRRAKKLFGLRITFGLLALRAKLDAQRNRRSG